MAKYYEITFGDQKEIVEQDTPLRAIEEIVTEPVTEVTISKVKYSVVEVPEPEHGMPSGTPELVI